MTPLEAVIGNTLSLLATVTTTDEMLNAWKARKAP